MSSTRRCKFYESANSRWGRLLPRPLVDALCLRRAAVSVLGEMGDAAKPAWPALLALETEADPVIRQRAAEILRALSQRNTEVNTALSECLLTPGLPLARVVQVVEQYSLRTPRAIRWNDRDEEPPLRERGDAPHEDRPDRIQGFACGSRDSRADRIRPR